MMFFDACLLVQIMRSLSRDGCDPKIYDFLSSNEGDIFHDIMLLENQIPWLVVKAVYKTAGFSKKNLLLLTWIQATTHHTSLD